MTTVVGLFGVGTCVAAPAGLKRMRRTKSFLVLSYMRIRCTVFLTKRHPLKDDPKKELNLNNAVLNN